MSHLYQMSAQTANANFDSPAHYQIGPARSNTAREQPPDRIFACPDSIFFRINSRHGSTFRAAVSFPAGRGDCRSKIIQNYFGHRPCQIRERGTSEEGSGSQNVMALPAALCRIAACASSPASAAASAGQRRERGREAELAFALAERGMVVGGHRGMGMNVVGAPPGARVGAARERENTLLSFGRAAAHAAVAFVEFDVQVTKDGYPIVFHDDFILTQGTEAVYERRVTDLVLEEFLSYGTQKDSRKVSKPLLRRTGDGRIVNWSTEEDDSLCTLQEVFECVNPRLGFNVELKFDDNIIYSRKDLECALQAILQVVFQYASNRPVFFSTFHPDAARMMRELQSLYPVLFLTEGGTAKHNDSRRNSLDEAIRVCQEYGLHGIVSEVRGVFKNPSAALRAQESNLAFLTYGQLNNVWEAVYVQYLMGVNGVIVDMVEEISNAVADLSRQPLSQSSLNGGVSSMDGSKHQAFSQQQLGFLLRLIPELIEQRH